MSMIHASHAFDPDLASVPSGTRDLPREARPFRGKAQRPGRPEPCPYRRGAESETWEGVEKGLWPFGQAVSKPLPPRGGKRPIGRHRSRALLQALPAHATAASPLAEPRPSPPSSKLRKILDLSFSPRLVVRVPPPKTPGGKGRFPAHSREKANKTGIFDVRPECIVRMIRHIQKH